MNSVTKTALAIGAIGIGISCLALAGNSSPNTQIGIMISGALIFGSGVIASAISSRKSDN